MTNTFKIISYTNSENLFIPYCVCFHIKNKYHYFYGTDCLQKTLIFIFEINENIIFYIHNLNFDGFLILWEASKTFQLDFFMYNNSLYWLLVSDKKYSIKFKCSFKILPLSLKKIAQDFNLPTKLPYPYKGINETNFHSKYLPNINDFSIIEEFYSFTLHNSGENIMLYTIEYGKRDIEITSKFLKWIRKFIKTTQKIDLHSTLSMPSLSLNCFKRNYNQFKINLNISSLEDSYTRNAYYGGRCEVFGNSDNAVYHYDFPGMYGICMLEEKFAFGEWQIIYNINPLKLKPGFYKIKWKSINMRFPILPIKNEFDKLIFPNGTHIGIYWFEEINFFLENGGIVLEIFDGIIYKNFDYVFTRFVEHFNYLRNLSNSHKTLSKLIINSLYGKLGFSKEGWKYKIINDANFIKDIVNYNSFLEENTETIIINNIAILKKKSSTKLEKNNVSLAAMITSKARIKLLKKILEVEKNGGKVLYTDTDSLFVEFKSDIYNNIKWQKFDRAIFVSPKCYALKKNTKETIKIKGILQNSIPFDLFEKNFKENKNLTYINNHRILIKNFIMSQEFTKKTINLNLYDKRKFIDNYYNTIALTNSKKKN